MTHFHPADKLELFNNYFNALYKSSSNPNDIDICNFLSELSLPKLTQVHLQISEASVTIKEIVAAIDALKTRNTPGSHGLMAEFNKKFKTQLVLQLHRVFINSLQDGQIPKSWLEARVLLIPKPS